MNRLFLRIFILLALAVFGSGALVIGFFDYGVFPSENRKLEPTIGPGVAAIAQRIAAGEPAATVFRSVHAEDALALVRLDVVPLGAADRRRLLEGHAVISGDGPNRSIWAQVPDTQDVVEFALLSHHHSRTSWVVLPETRATARPATASENASLTDLNRARLQWRSIALDRGRVAWLVDTELRVVDLPSFFKGRQVGMGFTLLGTAAVILLSLLPVRRELLALGAGARQLRDGDLSARIDVGPKVGPVGEVSVQVNAMADRVERLVASNEELLRSVSHELQTPVARLLFSIDALQQEPERVPELAEGMRVTVDEMRALANEVLDFNRLGGERLSSECEEVDLAELAGDVTLAFDGVEMDTPPEGALVWGESRLLYRALRNLVENAVVYGTVPRLRVTLEPEQVSVHVDDGGPGVPEAEWEAVFEAFHRVEGSRARTTGGTGLGLAIVRRIAERHGGRAVVSTSPEGGARFTLSIPRQPTSTR